MRDWRRARHWQTKEADEAKENGPGLHGNGVDDHVGEDIVEHDEHPENDEDVCAFVSL